LNFEDEFPTEDEYATKGDLRYEVGRLEREVRDGDEKIEDLKQQIEDLKQQIEGLERYADRLRSDQLRFDRQTKRMSDRLVLAYSQLKNVSIEEGHDTGNDGQQRCIRYPIFWSFTFGKPTKKAHKQCPSKPDQ